MIKDHNWIDVAYNQVDDDAAQEGAFPDVDHDYLVSQYTVKEEGYVFVYISNNNPTQQNVYFDDVTVTYTPTRVLQYNEYYPFGLQTANSWVREGNKNDYLYNAASELNQSSGWYETFFRGYDPALGRFLQTDPLADVTSSVTPYQYAFNNPVYFNDPLGDRPRPGDWIPIRSTPTRSVLDDMGSEGSWYEDMFRRAAAGDAYAVMTYAKMYGTSVGSERFESALLAAQSDNVWIGREYMAIPTYEYLYSDDIHAKHREVGTTWIPLGAHQGGPDDAGIPLFQWTDPSSLKIKRIGDSWYGSAQIDERIGVSPSVQLNTTVNFMVKASHSKKEAQYLLAKNFDVARVAVYEMLQAHPGMTRATAANEFKAGLGVAMMLTFWSSQVVTEFNFMNVPTFEVKFKWLPPLPPLHRY